MLSPQHLRLQLPAGSAHQVGATPRLVVVRSSAGRRICPRAASAIGDVADSITGSRLDEAKRQLLSALAGTERGGQARGLQRGLVEEAQVAVEALSSGVELDFSLLPGKWRLQYTTARDVLPLVSPQRPGSPIQVGRIYQQFSSPELGAVQNIIEARLAPPPLPLLAGSHLELGLQFLVDAVYETRTARSIALTFREAGVRDVVLSEGLQNLLASPLLPRGWWNQYLLLAIKQLAVSVPLSSRLPGISSSQQLPVGINYMLTHLDEDMLIGRAQNGTFVFTREQLAGEA